MQILNASPEPVKAQYDGAYYYFKSGERKDIINIYAAKHILQRWGKYGLVDITFNETLADKFKDHELYVHEKRIEGLQSLLETLYEQNQNFASFDQECGQKQTVTRLKYNNMRKDVLSRIKAVEEVIKNVTEFDTQKLLDEKAQKLIKQAEELKAQASKLRGDNAPKSKDGGKDRVA